ncbi:MULTISPECIES: polysaccharide pyruvyl transferase family protein [unclassified Pseudarthrobacter]|uniref:polysaccharide pyruvyl transferase family protein n=1 Tax=unclassified Pseudarthrobacter TaxID=2647000 RepID=UPI0030781640
MKVLILRADSSSPNLGVRVLAHGTEALARQAWGEQIEVDFQNFDGGTSGQRFDKKAVTSDIFRKHGPIKTVLRRYDVIIDACGGDSFTDIYGIRRLALILYTQRTGQRLGIPVVLGPQTIGPFQNKFAKFAASRVLKAMSAVVSRDGASARYAEDMGRTSDAAATDVVFALPVPESSEKRDIILNVSGLLWNSNKHVSSEEYRSSIRSLIKELLAAGRRVSLLAHVLDNPREDNDVPVALLLEQEFQDHVECIIPTSLEAARIILAGANVVIGSRMHACLNALSTGTPVIPWAYSRKFAPLMNDIGWQIGIDLRETPAPVTATMKYLKEHSQADLDSLAVTVGERARARLSGASDLLRERIILP